MQARQQIEPTPFVTAHPVYHTTLDTCGCGDFTQYRRLPKFSCADKRRCTHIAAAEAEIIHFGTTLCGRNGEPSCGCCEFTDGADDCLHIKLMKQSRGPAPKAPALAKERPVVVIEDIAPDMPRTFDQRLTLNQERQAAMQKARNEALENGEVSFATIDLLETFGIDDEDAFWESIEPLYAMSHGYVPDADWQDTLPPYSNEYQTWERAHGYSGHRLSAQR